MAAATGVVDKVDAAVAGMATIARNAKAAVESANACVAAARGASAACGVAQPAVAAQLAAVSRAANNAAQHANAISAAIRAYANETAKAVEQLTIAIEHAAAESDAHLQALLEGPEECSELLCCSTINTLLINETASTGTGTRRFTWIW
jgi:cell division septum initiation protein DivIVA